MGGGFGAFCYESIFSEYGIFGLQYAIAVHEILGVCKRKGAIRDGVSWW